jgi:ABC-type Fe3+/spermidine/putrescine transport system ATPase subunit
MSKLVLAGLGKSFGTVPAVQDISLTLQEGEFVSLLGRPAAARPPRCG